MLPQNLSTILAASWLPTRYRKLADYLRTTEPAVMNQFLREEFRRDLWLLLVAGLRRTDLAHPWLYARCREIEREPDGYIDLWARGHYKSTIITFGKTIQDILASHGRDPLPEWEGAEPCFGIFSHTRPTAKAFLRQIKEELQQNAYLKALYPDILYEHPERHAPRWSDDAGLVVKRHSNPKESTVEAWGLIDGQPTSKHFPVLVYDDVISQDQVSNPDMIQKVTQAWEVSLNLGVIRTKVRTIGTRWHFNDTYKVMMDRGRPVRKHPATEDGTLTGTSVFLPADVLADKFKDMGPYQASAQLLLNPIANSSQSFRREWLNHRWEDMPSWEGMNRTLIVDPASSKKKGSDYTAMGILAKGPDKNYYLLDGLRDRLNLKERAAAVMRLHKKWRPQRVGYEKYGLTSDIEYIKEVQARENYRFEIEELGGKLGKYDRINRLIPDFAEAHWWLPDVLPRTNTEGKLEDVIEIVIEQEFLAWPVPAHDDFMDMMARIYDLEDFSWPMLEIEEKDDRYRRKRKSGGWMGA